MSRPRRICERVTALKVLLLTGSESQQYAAREALQQLANSARNVHDIKAAVAALESAPLAPKPKVKAKSPAVTAVKTTQRKPSRIKNSLEAMTVYDLTFGLEVRVFSGD